MIDNSPLVSVLMPVYNASLYLSEAIKSILEQDYKNFEFIIINDGSTDDSESIILNYKDSRIKYIKNEQNLKLIATLNIGLSIAQGKYIARMDADDISLSNRFRKQVSFLEQNNDYGIVGSNAKIISRENKVISYPLTDNEIKYSLIFFNPFIHSSVIIRKSILDENKLHYDETKLHVEDYDLWVKIMSYSKGYNIEESLVLYRIHENQVSNIFHELQKINTIEIQIGYLISIGLNRKQATLIVNLFDSFSNLTLTELFDLIKNIKKINWNTTFLNSERLENTVIKTARNRIIERRNLNFKEFSLICLNLRRFSVKQFLHFTKIVFMTR